MKHISKGAFHLHSTYSDGTGTIRQIAADAKKTGLDWIVITDHNNLLGLHNNEEGWYDGLAVIIGEEISPKSSDHYLALNIKEQIPCSLSPYEFIQEVKKQGGIGFIAHPDESLTRRNKFPPLRWTDWNITGFDGIEIWNYMSDWGDNYDDKLYIYNLITRHHRLKGPTKNTLQWWDKLNNLNGSVIPAVGSLDSHAFKHKIFEIFPYIDTFKTITNYLIHDESLSSDFETAKAQILKALKQGNNIIINRFWNKKKLQKNENFYFGVITKDKEVFPGQKAFIDSDSKLLARIPQVGDIKIYKNGELFVEKKSDMIEINGLTSGKYRMEVYFKNKPWIFSNPVICHEEGIL